MTQNQINLRFQIILGVSLCIISTAILIFHFNLLSLFGARSFPRFGTNDFIEYWSAFRALADKSNPYDPVTILKYQNEVLGTSDQPLMMWNPPWLLVTLAPLLAFSFIESARIWFALSLISTIMGSYLTWAVLSDQKKHWTLIMGTSVFFFPIWYSLALGQVSGFVFLGCAMLLWSTTRKQFLLFGPGIILVSLKPHLAYLWLIALIWWTIKRKESFAIISTFACFISLIVATVFFWPESITLWLRSLRNLQPSLSVPILAWQTPTLAGLVRALFGVSDTAPIWPVIFVPGITTAVFLVFFIRRSEDIDWRTITPWLLCVSHFSAPFGWIFDCSILLITQISALSMLIDHKPTGWRIAGLGLFTIQIATLLLSSQYITSHDQYFWFSPLILIYWLACKRRCLKRD